VSARRVWALPLVPLYAAGLTVKDGLRAAGLLKVRRLQWPVVSVGSLSAGGAGKTPVVMVMAELLQERGWTVDVLSRGYRNAQSHRVREKKSACICWTTGFSIVGWRAIWTWCW
jgi:tetraacyldisaccharide-1-P 4'-kinase